MNYRINLGAWNSVFAVPCSIVDNHIKLAGAAQLKVLLWLLRHAGDDFTDEDMARALAMSKADARDSMQYWIETGIIAVDDGAIAPASPDTIPASGFTGVNVERESEPSSLPPATEQNLPDAAPAQKSEHKLLSRPQKPDPTHLAERMASDESIAFLMREADGILGRITSNSDKCTLLMINEYDGLPVEVIIMLLQYLQDIGKTNMKYIEKVASSWGDKEITTVERAEHEIVRLTQGRNAARIVEQTFGLEPHSPTDNEITRAERWVNEWHFAADMIREAYERCVDAKGKYIPKYVDSILKRWHDSGIETLEQAMSDKKNKKQQAVNEYEPTYNLEAYENSSIFDE